MGGMSLWYLAYLAGFQKLGHDVYFVERSTWENSCYDVSKKEMTSDFTYGLKVVREMMDKYDLNGRWCFVDEKGGYHGISKPKMNEIFRTADIYIDMEWGEWEEESAHIPKRLFFDGEPGWLHIKFWNIFESDGQFPNYNYYFTAGENVGGDDFLVDLCGVKWHHTYSPILPDDTISAEASQDAPFTTIMNWQSHKVIEYGGKMYGQKDVEFEKFIALPQQTKQRLEMAVSGKNVPRARLAEFGWHVCDADKISISVSSYLEYIAQSRGEFSVSKNVFVETRAGLIGDRSAYYLYYGKPVIHQDTGFSKYLPVGNGLFGVRDKEEAAAALDAISSNYQKHSNAAKEIAREYFMADKVIEKVSQVLAI
jgi:hypothetical protein